MADTIQTDDREVSDYEAAVDEVREVTEASGEEAAGGSKVEQIMSMENMINGYMIDLEKLQSDYKAQSAMLKDAFENDAEYQAIQEKVRDIGKMKKEIKDRIMQDPAIANLDAKVSDLRAELKDTKQALSDYLQQYFMETGMRQITGSDGEVREIVTSVRLVKKRE